MTPATLHWPIRGRLTFCELLWLWSCICIGPCCSCSAALPAAPEQHAATAGAVRLDGADADVWAFRTTVSGAANGAFTTCVVRTEHASFPARLNGTAFTAAIELDPGENRVEARCRSSRAEVPSSPLRLRVRLSARPTAEARAFMMDGVPVLDGRASRPDEWSAAPITRFEWYDASAGTRRLLATEPRATLPAPPGDGRRTFELVVTDALGHTDVSRTVLATESGVAAISGTHPLDTAVVYGVVPPLYGDPPLAAVERNLPRLAALGVDILWLSPVFETSDRFGYSVTDAFHVRPDYGTEEDLRRLVAAAHHLGMKVLLDFVPNHTSREHPYFVQTEQLGAASRYFAFYDRSTARQGTHYFDWAHLPNLDYSNAEVRRWMSAAAAHWIRDFDVDGYRMDAAWAVRERDPNFFAVLSAELRRVRPDAVMIAEGPARDAYYQSHGFDSAYDWGDAIGRWAWEGVFDTKGSVAARLDAALRRTATTAPRPERVLRFLDNNDTGARFVSRYGVRMTFAAVAALMTLPGVPCVYSFDEVGAEFEPYADTAPPAPRHPELNEWYRRLIHLRREVPALHAAGFFALAAGTTGDVYAFARYDDRTVAIVLVNFGDRETATDLALPRTLAAPDAPFRDALGGETLAARRGIVHTTVPAFGARVLLPITPRPGSVPAPGGEPATHSSHRGASAPRAYRSRR